MTETFEKTNNLRLLCQYIAGNSTVTLSTNEEETAFFIRLFTPKTEKIYKKQTFEEAKIRYENLKKFVNKKR